jgi:hypothetical protein
MTVSFFQGKRWRHVPALLSRVLIFRAIQRASAAIHVPAFNARIAVADAIATIAAGTIEVIEAARADRIAVADAPAAVRGLNAVLAAANIVMAGTPGRLAVLSLFLKC